MPSIQKTFVIITLSALIVLPTLATAKSTNAANPNGQPSAVNPTASSGSDDLNQGAKNWKDKLSEFKEAKEADKIARLKELGVMLIENRISLLAKLKTRIQGMESLTAEEKNKLTSDIDTNIADLNTLKTKIAADTDLATLKADIKSIFEKFRVYMVVAPRNLGQSSTKQGMYILGRLEAIERQLQTMLDQNKNAGKDTSSIQLLIDQVNAKLADAKTQLAIAEEKFKLMTPANTEAAKTARDAGKAAMKQAKQDLKDAHSLLKQISEKLKAMSFASPSSSTLISPAISPSATATPTPTPSAS